MELTEQEEMLIERFREEGGFEELEFCPECEGLVKTEYETTIKADIDGPSEGVVYCTTCRHILDRV